MDHVGNLACAVACYVCMTMLVGVVWCRADEEILADAFEALVGAVYLDSGLEAASKFLIGLAEVRDFVECIIVDLAIAC